jgi:hypothetical protein
MRPGSEGHISVGEDGRLACLPALPLRGGQAGLFGHLRPPSATYGIARVTRTARRLSGPGPTRPTVIEGEALSGGRAEALGAQRLAVWRGVTLRALPPYIGAGRALRSWPGSEARRGAGTAVRKTPSNPPPRGQTAGRKGRVPEDGRARKPGVGQRRHWYQDKGCASVECRQSSATWLGCGRQIRPSARPTGAPHGWCPAAEAGIHDDYCLSSERHRGLS